MSGSAVICPAQPPAVAPELFYRRMMQLIGDARVPYLIGGTHALRHQTGLPFHTRDFDILLRRDDLTRVRLAVAAQGYDVEMTHPHFVAKVYEGDVFVDLIFGSGNGLTDIDDDWFAHASWGRAFGVPVRFCSAEDLLWSKAFIMERERFDGADVAHLILTCGDRLDWKRLVARFGEHWRVLLSHLVMFEFAYPGQRERVPVWVMDELLHQFANDRPNQADHEDLCRGTLVSRRQYLLDLRRLGMRDARQEPEGPLTSDDIDRWTAAAEAEANR